MLICILKRHRILFSESHAAIDFVAVYVFEHFSYHATKIINHVTEIISSHEVVNYGRDSRLLKFRNMCYPNL